MPLGESAIARKLYKNAATPVKGRARSVSAGSDRKRSRPGKAPQSELGEILYLNNMLVA